MPDKPCHYDVLGLERDASDEEIKRVYRRLALFWHPDKNTPEQREEATEVFRLVTEAYAVLGDPKKREKYDRDGHPPSAGGSDRGAATSSKKASPPAPTAPPAPPAAAAAPSAPQYAAGGWAGGVNAGDGGWEGMPVNGGYGQCWMPQQQQQQQQYPFHQAPSPFMQQQHQFQQQPDLYQQQQGNAFMYGNQYGHQAYPFQPQHQHHPHQAPPSWSTPYGNFDAGGAYGVPAPAPPQQPPMPPEPAAGPPSTELALPGDLPRTEPAAYPGGYPHQHAAAPSHGIVAHAAPAAAAAAAAAAGGFAHQRAPMGGGGGGFRHHRAPMYDDLPPAAVAPPSTYPPSSESEDSSESESESEAEAGGRQVVVTRNGSAAPAAAPAVSPQPRRQIVRRAAPKKSPYPTETRYVPPAPERLNSGYYPKETRVQQHEGERPGVSRSGSGLVLKLHLGTKPPDRPPTSVGPPMSRSRSGSQGGVGGLIQQMDRMFSDVMGGGMLGAGLSLDMAGEEGSGRGMSRSFTAGGGGGSSRGGGYGTASMMSSRTVVDAGSRTLFARTERTVLNADGTRETNVQEYSDNRGGSSRGSVSGSSSSRVEGGGESPQSAGTSRRGSLRSFFGR
eukprot:g16746.t1